MHFQKRKNQKEIAKPNYAIKNLHIIIYWITFAKQILVSFLHTTTYLIDLISIFWIYASIIYIFHCFYSNFAAVFVMVKMNFKVVKSTMSWGRVNIELGKRGGDTLGENGSIVDSTEIFQISKIWEISPLWGLRYLKGILWLISYRSRISDINRQINYWICCGFAQTTWKQQFIRSINFN